MYPSGVRRFCGDVGNVFTVGEEAEWASDIDRRDMLEVWVWEAEAKHSSVSGQRKASVAVPETLGAQGGMSCNRVDGLG